MGRTTRPPRHYSMPSLYSQFAHVFQMNQLLVFVGFFGLCGGTVFIGIYLLTLYWTILGVLLSHINALLFLNNVKSSWVGTRCEVINKQWRYACANATDEHWVNDTDTTSCSSITGSRLLVAFNDSKEISKNAIMWDFPWSLYDTNQDKGIWDLFLSYWLSAKSKMFLHSFTLGQRKECYFDPAHPSEDSKVVLKEQWVGFDKKVSQEFFVFLGLACMYYDYSSSVLT